MVTLCTHKKMTRKMWLVNEQMIEILDSHIKTQETLHTAFTSKLLLILLENAHR